MKNTWIVAPALVVAALVALILVLSRRQSPVVEQTPASANQPSNGALVSAPIVSASPAIVPPSVPSAPLPAPSAMSEPDLMTELRADQNSNPARALALAEDAEQRFPNSADAPEYEMIKIKALYKLDRMSEGRGAAEKMVNQYPGNPYAIEVEQHTGAHPHVNHPPPQ